MTTTIVKVPRAELVAALVVRDGDRCQFPGCNKKLDFSLTDGPREVTIDHWMPQVWCKEQGWSPEQIWDISNLKLMEKRCNALKGDRLPDADGLLPERVTREFRYRREKRAQRPDLCTSCNSGRDLGPDEVCASCNSGPQPERFPRWAKVKASECDHELFWCAWCSIGIIERAPAMQTAIRQSEAGEDTIVTNSGR